uniref:F-box/LRR-repeat protein 15-like leucin rich repeat domain-containing protein n=1 Tax=Chenopodium quinoa TaxID=63459 RepID=A0A803LS04_CHEQI
MSMAEMMSKERETRYTHNNGESTACINEALRDDELRAILAKLECTKDKEVFGLVCKRWLHLQSSERRKLCARAGPHMLRRLASRFFGLLELDLSQSLSRSFGITDSDLSVVADGFPCITDAGLVAIGSSLHSLQSLDLSHCKKVTDKGLSAAAKGCNDLRFLRLEGCRFITDTALKALSENCRNLEALVLQGCMRITDSGLTILASGCRQLKYLDLNKCTNVGDAGISSISEACYASLRTLKVWDCYKVGDGAIYNLAKVCKSIETLIIGGCRDITDESIKSLVLSCHYSLKNLRMDWCLSITDSSVSCILMNCKNLEGLDVRCCEELTDGAFSGLGRGDDHAANLKVLKLGNCPKITLSGLAIVLDSCKLLTYLDVSSCPHITKAGLDEAGLQIPETCKVNFNGSLTEPLDMLV